MTSARARGKQELDAEICGMRFMYIRDCTSMHNDDVCFSLSVCVCMRVSTCITVVLMLHRII